MALNSEDSRSKKAGFVVVDTEQSYITTDMPLSAANGNSTSTHLSERRELLTPFTEVTLLGGGRSFVMTTTIPSVFEKAFLGSWRELLKILLAYTNLPETSIELTESDGIKLKTTKSLKGEMESTMKMHDRISVRVKLMLKLF